MDFSVKPEPKCKKCGYVRGKHKARTLNCPMNGRNFTHYLQETFEEKPVKKSKRDDRPE